MKIKKCANILNILYTTACYEKKSEEQLYNYLSIILNFKVQVSSRLQWLSITNDGAVTKLFSGCLKVLSVPVVFRDPIKTFHFSLASLVPPFSII